MTPRKSARQRDQRIGMFQRTDTETWVVEMRPRRFKRKLNFGTYKTKQEAMVARDYGAYLRSLAGEEAADAGGFGQDGQSIYEFQESLIIFQGMVEPRSRLEEYRRVIPLYQQSEGRLDKEAPQKKFCEAARKDIAVALKQFQTSYPHLLATSLPTEAMRDAPSFCEGPCIPWPSNSEVRVSLEPTQERESGAITGHSDSFGEYVLETTVLETTVPVRISINIGDGFPLLLLDTVVSLLRPEQIFGIIEDHINRKSIEDALTKADFDKILEGLPSCTADPKLIPEIDVSEDDLKT